MNENKLKALREIWAAKLMMLNEDYIYARDRLRTAQRLYPALDDIEPMLTVCDVLVLAAGIKLSDSEVDSCWVFKLLKPSEKLLSSLQTIRDGFPGTDLALEYLYNAFCKLSDREKHSECDLQCSLGGCMDKTSSSNNFGGLDGKSNSTEVNSERSRSFEPFPLHEFDKDEQDQDGLITSQATCSENSLIPYPMHITLRESNQEFYNFEKKRNLEFIQEGQIWAAHFQANVKRSYRYAQINYSGNYELSVTWLKPIPVSPSETRWYFAGLPVGCGSFDLNPVTHDSVSPMIFSHKCSAVRAGTEDQFDIYPKKGEIWALYKNWNQDEWATNPQKLRRCKFNLVEMLSDLSKASGGNVVCLEGVEGFRSVFRRQIARQYHIPSDHLYIFSHSIPAYRLLGGDKDKDVIAIYELDQSALPDGMVHESSTEVILMEENLDSSPGYTLTEYLPSLESRAESKLLKHPWSTNDFAIGQVWAVYCRNDSMPRPYVRIDKVISEHQVFVTFLEPLPVFHLDIEWKKQNLPVACGLFEHSKTSVILTMSHFCHSMVYERSISETDSYFIIYPKKGEVWAVYKDWNEGWMQNDYRNCHYYIVEILSDFLDESGMRIARLAEVENNLTFFHRHQHDGCDIVRTVSQAEMFSFSHRIPAFKVQGTARYGIPEDSWHLDPNALPQQVISYLRNEQST